MYRDIGDRPNEAEALNDIGAIYESAACHDEALAHHQRARAIAEEVGNLSQQLIALRLIADIHRGSGRYGEALDSYQAALRMAREGGEPYEEGKILEGMAEAWLNSHRFNAAPHRPAAGPGHLRAARTCPRRNRSGSAWKPSCRITPPAFPRPSPPMPSLTLPMPVSEASICSGIKSAIASGKVSVKVRARCSPRLKAHQAATPEAFMAGSILPDYSPSAPTDYDWPVPDRLIDSAEQFLTLFHQENNLGSPDHRIRQVRREIEFSGSYWHTPAELAFGARVAWRNSSRCIGRLYWHSLRVRDRREISSAADIAAER